MVAMILVLAILSLVALGVLAASADDQHLLAQRVEGVRADAASESAARVAAREVLDDLDHDDDGVIGSVSASTLGLGSHFQASSTNVEGLTTIRAAGDSGSAARAVEVTITPRATTLANSGGELYFSRHAEGDLARSSLLEADSTWSTPSSLASAPPGPGVLRVATSGNQSILLTSNAAGELFGAIVLPSGSASVSPLSTSIGSTTTRPFDVASEPNSSEALAVYYDQPAGCLHYRTLSDGQFSPGAPVGSPAVGVTWVALVPMAPDSDSIMLLAQDQSRMLHAARWNGVAWTDPVALSPTQLYSASGEGFAGAIEPVSGRLVVAFSEAARNRVGYRVFTPGVGWSTTRYRSGFGARVQWLRLVGVPNTNQVFLAAGLSTRRVRTSRWNTVSWSGTASVVGNTRDASQRRFDLAASPDGSRLLIVYGKGTSRVFYRRWTGRAWSREARAFSLTSGAHKTILARPGPSGSAIVGAVADANAGVNAWCFDGNAFFPRQRVGVSSPSNINLEWFALSPGTIHETQHAVSGWAQVAPE